MGQPEYQPLKPSEEHLPIEIPAGARVPAIGDKLYLIPRHVCPTVNNFDEALMVRGGRCRGRACHCARTRVGPGQRCSVPLGRHYSNLRNRRGTILAFSSILE